MKTETTAAPIHQTASPNLPVEATPGRRSIVGAAAIVMLFFVLSRVVGLVREMVIAAQFGAGAELDAYLAAFRVPDLLFQLIAGGALGSAFIPTFAGYWTRGDQEGAWLLFSRILNLITLLLLVAAGLAALFALPLVRSIIAPGFPLEQQLLTASLMRWMLFGTILFGASGLIMAALNAVQHFLLPAAAPVLYNLAIIGGAWLLAPRLGVYGLALGVVGGALAHLMVQLPGLWRVGARYSFALHWDDPGVHEVARLMGPRVLGLFFVQMHFLVNTILASGLEAGSLSWLYYAWLLMLLPQGIFAQSLATATFPTLASEVAAGQLAAMRQTFSRTLRLTLFLTIPAAVGLVVLSTPLVSALLQREQFTATSTLRVAHALQLYALGLAAHAALEIVVRAFYALHDTKTPVVVGVAAMLLNILLSLVWVGPFGYGGLALANSVATTVEAFVLLGLLRRQLQGFEEWTVVRAVGRQFGAALVMGGALWLWLQWGEGAPWLTGTAAGAWVLAGGGLLLGASIYLGLMVALAPAEVRPLLALVQGRLFGRRLR
ncbi:MAG: murein biosynthesis integral membrane protein MurJ [Chloroflexi bacterium]|nr:MAG: murein biosynthesis integral membrane protein MurJ [Chloroflexota bacterium]